MKTALYCILLEEESSEGQRMRRAEFYNAHCLRLSSLYLTFGAPGKLSYG
jgi:hypothetical protein